MVPVDPSLGQMGYPKWIGARPYLVCELVPLLNLKIRVARLVHNRVFPAASLIAKIWALFCFHDDAHPNFRQKTARVLGNTAFGPKARKELEKLNSQAYN